MSNDYGTSTSDGTLFPDGLRVLAVDDSVVCLKVLVTTLEQCRYRVTSTTRACQALEMLRGNPENFDIVITDVKMPDMDGFALLEIIGLEMDIPVIMTSGTDDKSTVLKGIIHGARDYLLKPVRVNEIKNIWQHVVRKNLFGSGKPDDIKGDEKDTETEKGEKGGEEEDYHPKEQHDLEDESPRKKQRLNWTSVLHIKFLNAIHQLGTADKAVPKKILEIMNEPGLSRENVASHLQKYRKMLRKNETKVNQQRDINNNNNLDPSRRGRRPTDAAIFSESQSCSSRNPDSTSTDKPSSSLMYGEPLLPLENQDMLMFQFQACLQSPQLAVSSRRDFPGLGGLPTAPFWQGIPSTSVETFFPGQQQQLHGDYMDVPPQFLNCSTSTEPCPLPFSEPSFAFTSEFSPSYQVLPDASTGFRSTVNPNYFLVQHEGGLVNFNEGQTARGCPLNMQDPNMGSFNVNSQIYMQHCKENFDL